MICLGLAPLSLEAQTAEPDAGPVHHHVSFPRRDTQYVHVELQIPAPAGSLEISMPNWTPGSYLIMDYAGQVERVEARSGDGQALPLQKVSKNRWRIDVRNGGNVRISYDVWAGALAVNESWVESDFALLNGPSVFMFSAASRELPQIVHVELPADWAGVWVALPGAEAPRSYRAGDYDELVDSPILAGNAAEYPFEVRGAKFRLVNYGETALWDGQKAADDLAAVARAQLEFWQNNPFDREFLFLNLLLEQTGGLEHDHSTVMMAGQSRMRSREEYLKWLAMTAHELFHAWNVRRMRPRALSEYNYDQEVYTRELWLAEGLTSYYDNLLLFRSGVITVQEFFDLVAVEVQQYELQPGRAVRSTELSSFDSWIKHYKPNPNLINSNSSYYRKGSLIGLVIDAAIRGETDGNRSLDHVMREMYARYGPEGEGRGSYPPGAFEALVESVAGAAVEAGLKTLLTTVEDPDVDAALAWYGLSLDRAPERAAAEEAGVPAPVDFGVTWQKESPLLVIESVLHGRDGAKAGLLPGDELLAVNGRRVRKENHAEIIQSLRPGESVELTLVRHQRLITRRLTVQHAVPAKYRIVADERLSRAEKRRLESWLGRPLQFKQ